MRGRPPAPRWVVTSVLAVVALTVASLAGCGGKPEGPPRPVIVDTDMAADDWMAILYLLQHPGVDVIGVTVTGAGEAHCEPGIRNALDLIALAGEEGIPVACGRETPLEGDHTFPEAWRRSVDDLSGLDIPASSEEPSDTSAVDLLADLIISADEPVTVLTLGPLTNVGEALEAHPDLADAVEMIYVMGGAVDAAGNIHDGSIGNDVAEWNLYVDPHAAALTIASGAPVTLVPLDATNDVPVTFRFYDRLEAKHTTPEATFVYDLLTKNRGFVGSGGYYFWDPLSAAVVAEESLVEIETRSVIVIEEEGPESGRTMASPEGHDVRVAVAADRGAFERLFLDTLNRR